METSSPVLSQQQRPENGSPHQAKPDEGSGGGSLKNWLDKGFWAILDQGLYSGTNFLLSILLARWLTPSEFGAFVVPYSIFWFLAIFHTSFLTEPMLVFGAGRYKESLRPYFWSLLVGHFKICGVLSLFLLVCGYVLHVLGHAVLAKAFFALALAGPFMLLQWLMRRFCYLRFLPRLAAIGGMVYFSVVVAGVGFLLSGGWLVTTSILLLLGLASLLSSLWIAYDLQISRFSNAKKTLGNDPFVQHWHYGKWTVGAGFMAAIPDDLFSILLPIWGGLEASGIYKALTNLLMIPMHTLGALGNVFIPAFVKIQGRQDHGSMVFRLSGILLCATIGYWLCLGFFGEKIMEWLYKGKYMQHAELLWVIGLVPVFHGLTTVFTAVILAAEKPRLIFLARLCSTIVVLLPGIGLTAIWGVWGAGIGMATGFAASTLVLLILYLKKQETLSGISDAEKAPA